MLHSFEACVNQQRYRSPVGYLSALVVRDYATEGSAGCGSSVLTSAMALYVERKLKMRLGSARLQRPTTQSWHPENAVLDFRA